MFFQTPCVRDLRVFVHVYACLCLRGVSVCFCVIKGTSNLFIYLFVYLLKTYNFSSHLLKTISKMQLVASNSKCLYTSYNCGVAAEWYLLKSYFRLSIDYVPFLWLKKIPHKGKHKHKFFDRKLIVIECNNILNSITLKNYNISFYFKIWSCMQLFGFFGKINSWKKNDRSLITVDIRRAFNTMPGERYSEPIQSINNWIPAQKVPFFPISLFVISIDFMCVAVIKRYVFDRPLCRCGRFICSLIDLYVLGPAGIPP